MILFNTERLQVKQLKADDRLPFIELLSAPEIINPIPQTQWSEREILAMFHKFTDNVDTPLMKDMVIWGVYEKRKIELLGICALLTNDERQREIAYRFRKKYWGKGYGTELSKNMIDYCFKKFDLDLVTADVNVENIASIKILEKFFHLVREFYNEADQCWDRRYMIKKEDWEKRM